MRSNGKRPRGWLLSSFTLHHIEFLSGLLRVGAIDEKTAVALLTREAKDLPAGARKLLLPASAQVIRVIGRHIAEGRRQISIWSDTHGNRYVAADR